MGQQGKDKTEMMTLLITGSRDASPAMLNYARRCVQRAKQRGWSVIVGDAHGVDAAVMDECHRLGVPHVIVGGYDKIRRKTPSGSTFAHPGDYLARDRYMSQRCDICVAVHNGVSRGTAYTAQYAQTLGKVVHWKVFR